MSDNSFGNIDFSKFDFGNAENYRSTDDELSFRILVLKQLQKISNNANVEFRGGYWNKKAVPMQGGVTKITEEYIPDTREIYCNSIEFLHDLILPYFYKENSKAMKKARKDMLEASAEYDKEIKKLLDKYMKDNKFTEEEKMDFRQARVILCRRLLQYMSIYINKEKYFGDETN